MKIDEEPVDEVRSALIEFFEREGGYTQVAKKIGGNPQQLHYIIIGRNDPTLKTVMRILRHYPNEVKLREAISLPVVETDVSEARNGIAEVPQQQALPIVVQDLGPDGKPWKELAEEYRRKYERMLAKLLERDHPELFADQEGSKIESSSQPTAEVFYTRALNTQVHGLVRYEQPGQTDIDEFLNEIVKP